MAKLIPIRGRVGAGCFAIVNDEDFEKISKHKWRLKRGYAVATIKEKDVRMHRLIISPPTGYEIDHINRDRLDNQRNNLRVVPHQENIQSKKGKEGSSSQYKGVSLSRQTKKWVAQIQVDGRSIYLGSFQREQDAAKAYNLAAKQYLSEKAYLNPVE